jgi:hypothetical protein
MPRLKNKIFVFVAAMIAIAVPATSHAARAGRAQQAQAIDYMLDDALGKMALYPAPGYRSYVPSKYMVPSLEELERRVRQLPPGTKLHWTPYKRDPSGKPILFSNGQYDHFAKFCRDHKIELIISPSRPRNGKTG